MFVVLDVFSGTPNPNWELSPQLQSEFLRKISELGTIEKVQKHNNGLGYRGLIVQEKVNHGKKERRFEVNNGTIQVFENNESTHILNDQNREVEKWLITTAPNSVDQDLLSFVKNKINTTT